jgi:hypothetical protein
MSYKLIFGILFCLNLLLVDNHSICTIKPVCRKHTKFKAEPFVRVWQAAAQVTCQNGVSIGVEQWQESTA